MLLLSLGVRVVGVRGTTSCPTAAEVQERMGRLLPLDESSPEPSWIELHDVPSLVPGPADIEVSLVGTASMSAAVTGARRVGRRRSCAETADELAVIAASWTGRYLTPGPSAPTLPGDGADDGDATAAIARGADERAPSVVAASVGASAGVITGAAGGTAGSVAIEAEARRASWFLRLQVAAEASREVSFGGGRAAWRRLMAIPTVGQRWQLSRVFVDVGLGAAVGVTEARGLGFPTDARDTKLDLGIAPSVRVGARVPRTRVAIWLGAGALVWLRPHRVSLDASAETRSLPWWETTLGCGVSFLLGG